VARDAMTRFHDTFDWLDRASAADDAAPQELHGLLVEFETPEQLIEACRKVRDAGYTKWDALSPFPVHGIDEAMGIRATILPWLVLGAGITGLLIAFALQTYTNVIDYPFIISGKPLASIPSNIPVAFELTVLFSAFTAFIGMLVLNFLPELFHPIFRSKRYPRMTADRFGIYIEARDPIFNRQQAELMFARLGATAVDAVQSPVRRAPIPGLIHAVGFCVTLLLLIPPALIVKARYSRSPDPRIHIIQDMDFQERYGAQDGHPLLPHGSASMLPVAGTVARGHLQEDDHFYRGMDGDDFARGFPMPLSSRMLERGQERFAIYCAPCHGLTGEGDGLVARRADLLREGTWVPPTPLFEQQVLEQAEGQLFHTITNGVRNMPAYGRQIAVEDRWAIVAYVRALQRSQRARIDDVPADVRSRLIQ
jgi:hypothetical protein